MRKSPRVIACPQSGYSILEVLVAILVLSTGLLGLAGMQVITLRNNSGSYQRSQAAILAQDIADRIRANRNQALAGSYVLANASTPPADPGAGSDAYCTSNTCATSRIAQVDLWKWYSASRLLLPGLKVTVGCTAPPAAGACPVTAAKAVHTITIMWDDAHNGATGTGCTTAATDLQCYRLSFEP